MCMWLFTLTGYITLLLAKGHNFVDHITIGFCESSSFLCVSFSLCPWNKFNLMFLFPDTCEFYILIITYFAYFYWILLSWFSNYDCFIKQIHKSRRQIMTALSWGTVLGYDLFVGIFHVADNIVQP